MTTPLRQSTSRIVRLGPFKNYLDGVTLDASVTLSTADQAELLKAGGGASVDISGNTWAPVSGADGLYDLTLTAGNTDTVGDLTVLIADSGQYIPVSERFVVVEENVYDMVYTSGGDLGTTVDAILTDTGTTIPGVLGTPAGADLAADIAAIEAQTDDIGAQGAGLTSVPWNSDWDYQIQSEVEDAIVVYGLDHLVQAAVTGTDIADDSIIAQLVSKSATADWDSFVNTTDSLEAIADAGGAGDGSGFTAIPWNSAWDYQVQSEVEDAIVLYGLDHLVAASVTGTDVVDDSIIAQLVSSSATADWDDFDNTAESLEAIAAGGGGPSVGAIADAVWDEARSGHVVGGSFGEGVLVQDLTTTAKASVNAEVDTALTDIKLDHLVAVADSDDPVDNSIIAKIAAADGDWSTFSATTDALSALVDNIHDEVIEGSTTMRQIMRILFSAVAGISAGHGTATVTYRDEANTKNRITATVDTANPGNRTAVTLDKT